MGNKELFLGYWWTNICEEADGLTIYATMFGVQTSSGYKRMRLQTRGIIAIWLPQPKFAVGN